MQANRLGFLFAIVTTVSWGIWMTFIGLPSNPVGESGATFPNTLSYIVWSFVMILPALVALWIINFKLEADGWSILQGMTVGLLGSAGQLILFETEPIAPTYLLWPFLSLTPLVTIAMAVIFSGERVKWIGLVGIALAIVAGIFLNMEDPATSPEVKSIWTLYASIIMLLWGVQGYLFSKANETMKAESIFFYMTIAGLLLAPVAWLMTDMSKPINWEITSGPGLAAAIQILNAIGALAIVYAFRYGKAVIVMPLTNAGAPVIAVILSIVLAETFELPPWFKTTGIVLAVVATICMAFEEEKADTPPVLEG